MPWIPPPSFHLGRFVWLAPTLVLLLSLGTSPAAEIETRAGDWVVTGDEAVVGKHIRLDGNLVLEAGARLELENCTLEIIGSRSREHLVD